MGDKYQQNIFELLSEDGAKKQKAKQEVAPAKQEKAKPKAAAPAAAAPKKNQSSQGGRGRGRGRGTRGGQGRGQQQTPLGADDRNAQGANNNRGKQMSRRQRDEAFKRGDYGAPDAEGRQKRAYDKFSHSSGARRKQEKKGGHGAGNWGEKGKDEVAEEEKKEGEEVIENVEGEEHEGEGEDVEKEESDNEIDYEEFVERQKKESEELSKLVDVQEARRIDAAEFEGMKPLSKGNKDEQLFAITGGKKNKKKGAANQKDGKISADQVLNFQAPRQDNRRGGKGRQNNRQQRGGNKRSANVNLNDDKDFPSL